MDTFAVIVLQASNNRIFPRIQLAPAHTPPKSGSMVQLSKSQGDVPGINASMNTCQMPFTYLTLFLSFFILHSENERDPSPSDQRRGSIDGARPVLTRTDKGNNIFLSMKFFSYLSSCIGYFSINTSADGKEASIYFLTSLTLPHLSLSSIARYGSEVDSFEWTEDE